MDITAGQVVLGVVAFLMVATLGGWVVSIYNNLIEVRNNVEKAFNNIDVLLQQRHDELPKLIDTCKGYMQHERSLFEDITRLREHYQHLKGSEEKTRTENEINKIMGTLAHRWEAYPELKASANFLQLQERVSALESSIADRREFFNDSTNIFNIQIERFPDLLMAKLMRYHKRPYLDVPEEKKADVAVRFA